MAAHVDPLDRRRGAGDERLGRARPGSPARVKTRAVVVAVGVAVEQRAAGRRRRPRARRSRRRRGPRRRSGRRAARPALRPAARRRGRAARRRSSTSGSRTTQSRWTGTWTVPPIAAEAPKATWAVPRIFSSSSTLPVSFAFSLVPMPSSATLVPSSPCAVSSSSSARALGAARPRPGGRPRPSARPASSGMPTPAIVPSTTSVPSPVPSTGAMKPSPQGRLPKAPRRGQLAGVGDRRRGPRARAAGRCRCGQVIRASAPPLSSVGDRAGRLRRSPSMSALITRASISSVTPGRVAIRAPASLAALRAAVWESDWTVGARTTSAARHRRRDRRRRLGRVRVALGHQRQDRVGAGAPAPRRAAARRARSVAGLQITSTSSPAGRRGSRGRPRRSRCPDRTCRTG